MSEDKQEEDLSWMDLILNWLTNMYTFAIIVFGMFPNGAMQIVADKEVRTMEECIKEVVIINEDKENAFNAACFIKKSKHI